MSLQRIILVVTVCPSKVQSSCTPQHYHFCMLPTSTTHATFATGLLTPALSSAPRSLPRWCVSPPHARVTCVNDVREQPEIPPSWHVRDDLPQQPPQRPQQPWIVPQCLSRAAQPPILRPPREPCSRSRGASLPAPVASPPPCPGDCLPPACPQRRSL